MKLLIHWPENDIKPKGGPSGYLYNLISGFQEIGFSDYSLLPPQKDKLQNNTFIREHIPQRIRDIRRLIKFTKLPNTKNEAPVNYSDYDCIHFHSTLDMYLHREALKQYYGKVILTSHSPCAYHVELLNRLNNFDKRIFSSALKKLKVIDEYAFNRADYIIFPTEDSEEPYYHTWNEYHRIRNKDKYRYLLTGIKPAKVSLSRSQVRRKYNIPSDAFVISYVGRHNPIKGFDELRNFGLDILSDNNIWFLIAGKEYPIKGLNNPHWVECGWSNDPYSLIAASDLFILPNKETYFDIVLLEVLSLGQIVCISNTGGNRYFNNFESNGIVIYTDLDNLKTYVEKFYRMSKKERQELGDLNQKIYEQNFTCSVFARNYTRLINELAE